MPIRLRGLTAHAAAAWMVFFAATHSYWAGGGRGGLPRGFTVTARPVLLAIDIVSVPLCLLGAGLALALIRPWGRAFPRRVLLYLSWAVATLAVIHAIFAVGQDLLSLVGLARLPSSPADHFDYLVYEPFWMTGGLLFAAAAWCYQLSTRNASLS